MRRPIALRHSLYGRKIERSPPPPFERLAVERHRHPVQRDSAIESFEGKGQQPSLPGKSHQEEVCAHGIAHQTGREIGGVEEINPLISNHRVQRFPQCRRSEEHTSELQSLMRISYAVFCLKKKTTI